MSRMRLARRSALVVAAGTFLGMVASSAAHAQRSNPRPGRAASAPPPPAPATPYPGASIIVDPRGYGSQRAQFPDRHPSRRHQRQSSGVIFVPVPGAYGSGGGGVYDTNGRPLYAGYDAAVSAPASPDYPMHGTPDLSGSPYVVIDGGAMVVDFGNNDRRVAPSCAAQAAEATPDGRARTVFYRPQVAGLVLRAGQRGRVLGLPPAGASLCYSSDQYGRMVLVF
jgi:hypothetical protein